MIVKSDLEKPGLHFIVITYTPFLQPIFHIESLTFYEFILAGAASSVVFIAVEIEKIILRRRRRERINFNLKNL